MDVVPAQRQAQAERDRDLLVDRLQVARAPRSRQREGHEGPATGEDDESAGDALRRQAHDLRRVQISSQFVGRVTYAGACRRTALRVDLRPTAESIEIANESEC